MPKAKTKRKSTSQFPLKIVKLKYKAIYSGVTRNGVIADACDIQIVSISPQSSCLLFSGTTDLHTRTCVILRSAAKFNFDLYKEQYLS